LTFIGLGVTNAWRNLGRSLLAVAGMALAAAVLTSSLSLDAGHPGQAYSNYRVYLGGDVMVFPFDYQADAGDDLREAPYGRLPADIPGEFAAFFPEAYETGYLALNGEARPAVAGARWADITLDPERVAEAAGSLSTRFAGDAGIYAHYFLPALECRNWTAPYEGVPDPPPETLWAPIALRSRDIARDTQAGFGSLVVAGRGFEPGDSGRLVCVVNRERALTYRRFVPDAPMTVAGQATEVEPLPGSEEVDGLTPGQTVTVLLPRPAVDTATGALLLFDYSNLTPVTLEVVGLYSFPTHTISVTPVDTPSHPLVEQLHWASTDILVPKETLLALFTLAGGGAAGLAPVEVTLTAPDLGQVEAYSDALRELLPEYEVMSVPSLVSLGRDRGLPEPVLRLPSYGDPGRRVQPALAVDAGAALVFLFYLIAALLLATNMMVILTSRRKELGVLRAVGARSSEVLVTLVTEAVILSLLGGLAGFAVARVASTHVLVSNDRPLAEILALTATDLVTVVAVTVGFALVFGLIAARSAARLSPMEVLRQE